ncbi:MAG: DNA polymerase [Opitutaceae bacterium]|jgi:DNA polymerase elongation subunit (family B)|nr:DNA polymerase [Opitutaceae bacterium]
MMNEPNSPATMTTNARKPALCGVWIDGEGRAHLSVARDDGGREERVEEGFRPFAWLAADNSDFDAAGATLDVAAGVVAGGAAGMAADAAQGASAGAASGVAADAPVGAVSGMAAGAPAGAATDAAAGVVIETLKGEGVFTRLAHAPARGVYEDFLAVAKKASVGTDAPRPLESQFLLQGRRRLFGDMAFHQLRRCQLDIETASSVAGEFSDPARPGDRVLAIGLQFSGGTAAGGGAAVSGRAGVVVATAGDGTVADGAATGGGGSAESEAVEDGTPRGSGAEVSDAAASGAADGFSGAAASGGAAAGGGAVRRRMLVLDAMTDEAERSLLERLNDALREEDPDVIEGHNIFKFDLDYLRQRARRLAVPCAWGRFGRRASFRNSRLKAAERWVDFPRCDLPGRAVIDTWLLVQLHDITTRELTGYGLKDVAVYFGVTDEDAAENGGRVYLAGDKIHAAYEHDRERFLAYLADDLRETKGVADLLLPTYFEQARAFPILLQDAVLRGTTVKIDLLFLEEYYHARQACPAPSEVAAFAGGYTRSFKEGVFQNVLHFDVASLYPSLLLLIGRNPGGDRLGVFIPLLRRLREYRLKYKQLARTAASGELRAEYQARQATFKILINSFYGYLGFAGARFGDGALAAEVTRRGRDLLQALIDAFAARGCEILEADTDGIYLATESHFGRPEALLREVAKALPEGIELEHDGSYEAMFCYKSKNYALRDGKRILIRGSALRSRGIEPFLKKLTDRLIRFLLGAESGSPIELAERFQRGLAERSLPVAELAKSEILGQNPEAYERFIAGGGKPRRAAAEVALRMSPRPRMGERVSYYITAREKGKTSDWQRARPVELFDAGAAPYDPVYYAKKLADWVERYGAFLGVDRLPPVDFGPPPKTTEAGGQGELW